MQSAFDESSSCSRYHPSKGYSWDFRNGKVLTAKKETASREEPSSLFQRQRVDMLLAEITRKFPLPVPKPTPPLTEQGKILFFPRKQFNQLLIKLFIFIFLFYS